MPPHLRAQTLRLSTDATTRNSSSGEKSRTNSAKENSSRHSGRAVRRLRTAAECQSRAILVRQLPTFFPGPPCRVVESRCGDSRSHFSRAGALLTSAPRLPGTDGRKMSKSYGNAIFLTDAPEVVSKKLATMVTDPARKRRSDPGDPDVCPVFDLHKIFSAQETIDRVNRECRTAEIGCVDCKKLAAGHLNAFLAPIQERRKPYEQNPQKRVGHP